MRDGQTRVVRGAHDRIMTQFGEEVETKAILNTTGTPSPLGRVALGDIGLDQSADLSLLIEPHLAMLARINDTGDIRNSDSGLRNVRRFRQRSVEPKSNSDRGSIPITILRIPLRGISKTAPWFSLETVE